MKRIIARIALEIVFAPGASAAGLQSLNLQGEDR